MKLMLSMNLINVRLLLVMWLGLVSPFLVAGKDLYVAQTAQGSANGNDAADSLAGSWFNTASNWGAGLNQINPGDMIHLVGTFTSGITAQGSGSPGRYTTIYFEPGANFTMAAGNAIALGNNNYLLVDGGQNGLIQNTGNGTGLTQQIPVIGVSATPSIGNITVQNLTMTNLFVHAPGTVGTTEVGSGIFLYGAMTNIDVHGCTIAQIQHGIMLDYAPGSSGNWNIYSNVLLKCGWGIGIGSGNNNSMLTGLNISNNQVNGQSAWDTSNNYYHENGIYIFAESAGASVANVTVSGNVLGPDGGNNSTAALFMSSASGAGINNVLIYNNILFSQGVYLNNGFISLSYKINNTKILNNTLDANTSKSIGLNMQSCSNAVFYNNLYADGQQAVMINGYGWTSTLNAIDFNDYFNLAGGSAGWGGNGGGSFATWQSVGFDLHSSKTNPGFVNLTKGDFHLQLANNLGTNLTSLGISGLNMDKDGKPRPASGRWDAGAYQFNPGVLSLPVVPSAPQGLRVVLPK